MEDNLVMFSEEELPQTDDPKKKEKVTSNCLQSILIEMMNDRGLKDADVVKATGIAWPTWHGWISGEARTQLADDNLKKVMKFFNVHLEYLVYGIGDDTPAFNTEEENVKPDN